MSENNDTTAPKRGSGDIEKSYQKPKNFRKTFFRIFTYLSENKGLVILIVCALIISSSSTIAGSYFLKPLINDYILPKDFSGLAKALTLLAGIYLTGVLASLAQGKTTIKLAQRTIAAIRREMFDKMQQLPLKYFDAHTQGELMSRYTNDADNVQLMLEQSLTQLLSSVITFAGAIAFMIILSPFLFIVTATIIALMIFLSGKIGGRTRKYSQAQQKIMGELNGNIEESIGGLKEIKAFNFENAAIHEFERINDEFQKAATNANFFSGIIMPIMVNLNNISYAATAILGGILTVFGMFDIGSLASYLQFSRQISQPINQITNQMNTIFSAVAGAERIFEMMDEEPEIDEGQVVLEKDENADESESWHWLLPSGERVLLKGDVRFHDVYFSYEEEKPVLKNISLFAKPAQMIAFVGSTGAGKTTITNLINRFYDVQQGYITYDGIDVREINKDSLRGSLGMVLQDNHLFTDSVMNNIRYGRLDATDEECIAASKKANAHSFIKRLPDGYNTIIKGDEANISQGQKQLIAIARTYIASPPVMILDEATSSIDTRTERIIQKGMDELMKERTVFVIAHRLSTVRDANAIMVLEHGEIIERGDHDELLAQKGRYYQLYYGLHELI